MERLRVNQVMLDHKGLPRKQAQRVRSDPSGSSHLILPWKVSEVSSDVKCSMPAPSELARDKPLWECLARRQ